MDGQSCYYPDAGARQKGLATTSLVVGMFDTTARPVKEGDVWSGNVSFYSNEIMTVFEREGGAPPTATPLDRVPKNGTPIAE